MNKEELMKLTDEVLNSLGIKEDEAEREKFFKSFLMKLKKSKDFQVKGNQAISWIVLGDTPEYKMIIKAIDSRLKRK
jgi:hypothetical protein